MGIVPARVRCNDVACRKHNRIGMILPDDAMAAAQEGWGNPGVLNKEKTNGTSMADALAESDAAWCLNCRDVARLHRRAHFDFKCPVEEQTATKAIADRGTA